MHEPAGDYDQGRIDEREGRPDPLRATTRPAPARPSEPSPHLFQVGSL